MRGVQLKNIMIFGSFFIFALVLSSCGNKGRGVVGVEATDKLKPQKQVEFDKADLPYNLEVFISNVADNSYSNKNYFRLYVNKQLIQPQNTVDNTTGNYEYRLKLLPGYYNIKGVYYWNDGWKDVKTEIKAEDLVRVDEKGLTVLKKEIPKDWRGVVQGKNLRFEMSYTEFDQGEPASQQQFAMDTISNQQIVNRKGYTGSSRVKFQINTDPVKCDVYINDELIGSSPISWWVKRTSVHVVQVKANGYRTGIRVIPPEEMRNDEKVVVIMRLDALPNYSRVATNQTNPVDILPQQDIIDTTQTDTNQVTNRMNPVDMLPQQDIIDTTRTDTN